MSQKKGPYTVGVPWGRASERAERMDPTRCMLPPKAECGYLNVSCSCQTGITNCIFKMQSNSTKGILKNCVKQDFVCLFPEEANTSACQTRFTPTRMTQRNKKTNINPETETFFALIHCKNAHLN